ncbi:hypothetical protein OC834_006767 [Tilletia horrida]|nr:hypothetical protein OC834_006767 [Tilletia horrida]
MLSRTTAAAGQRLRSQCARCGGWQASGSAALSAPGLPPAPSAAPPQAQRRHPAFTQTRGIGQLPRNRFGRQREGTAAQASPFEVDIKMDEVKEALNTCGTVQKTWEWALANIWGASATTPTQLPPYGIHTAFYAPAIHSLFLHFRDSLRSPHAALSVLDVTRSRSAESLVLGSTPALYADAVKLHWTLRRDLSSVRDVVRMAKRIGILSAPADGSVGSGDGPYRGFGSARSRYSSNLPSPVGANEDVVLRKQVEIALDEARREALSGGAAVRTRTTRRTRESDDFDLDGEDAAWGREHIRGGRSGPSQLPWAQQQQLAIADDIAHLLLPDGPGAGNAAVE